MKATMPAGLKTQSGNVFFAIFGAVAVVSILGAGLMTFVKGPISSSVTVTRQSAAENQMVIGAQTALMGAAAQGANGDCDLDGLVEPVMWRAASGSEPFPTGGGLIPNTLASPKRDPWGTDYGYCVWDHGPKIGDPTCGAGAQRRLGGTNSQQYPSLAIISAGPDRTFQTTCRNFQFRIDNVTLDPDRADQNQDGVLDDSDNKLVSKAAGSDDLIFSYTYDEAVAATGDLWTLKSNGNAALDKKLEVAGGADFSGTGDFIGVTADALSKKSGSPGYINMPGIRLPDASTYNPACTTDLEGVVRTNMSATSKAAMVAASTDAQGFVDADRATVSFFSRPREGNAIVVTVRGQKAGGFDLPAANISDTAGNNYVQVAATGTNTDAQRVMIFAAYNINAMSSDLKITIDPVGANGANGVVGALEVSGIDSTSVDLTATAVSTSGTLPVVGTTAIANELAIGVIGVFAADGVNSVLDFNSAGSWKQPIVKQVTPSMSVVTKAIPVAGSAVSHTWTYNNAGSPPIRKAMVVFKPTLTEPEDTSGPKINMSIDGSVFGSFNISDNNPDDWALWRSTANGTPDIRKSGGGSIIPAVTLTNGGFFLNYSPYPRTIDWNGGTPTANGTNTGGVFVNTGGAAIGKGMQIVLPAGTAARRAKIYMSYYNASTVTVTATLSDGSAPALVNTSLPDAQAQLNDEGSGIITIDYVAASESQTLTVKWEITAGDPGADISVNGVSVKTLSSGVGAGTLNVNTNNGPGGSANLTALNYTDWAVWGANSLTPSQRKLGGGSIIPNPTLYGGGTRNIYTNDPKTISWTDGAPTASGSSTSGIFNDDTSLYKGFEIDLPASTVERTVKLYLGYYNTAVRVTMTLSDGSADEGVANLAFTSGQGNGVISFTYKSATDGQTLKLRWQTMLAGGNTTLNAIALNEGPASSSSSPAPVFSKYTTATGTGGVVAVTKPSGMAIGDLMLYMVSVDNMPTSIAWPTGFTQIAKADLTTPDGHAWAMAYKLVDGTEANTLTMTATGGSANRTIGIIAHYTGVDPAMPILTSSENHASVNGGTVQPWNATANSMSVATPNTTVVWMGSVDANNGGDNSVTFTPPSGFTERADLPYEWTFLTFADKTFSIAGATGAMTGIGADTVTPTATGNAGAIAVVLNPNPANQGGVNLDACGNPILEEPIAGTANVQFIGRTVSNATHGSGGAVTVNAAVPSGIKAGDLILVMQSSDGDLMNWPYYVGFTVGGVGTGTVDGQQYAWAWKIATGLETTYSLTGNSWDAEVIVAVYRNVDTEQPIFAYNALRGGGQAGPWALNNVSVSTLTPQDALVMMGTMDVDGTGSGATNKMFTFPAGFTSRANVPSASGWSPLAFADRSGVPAGASGTLQLNYTHDGNGGTGQLAGFVIGLRASTHVGSCQAGYTYFEGKCYGVKAAGSTWAQGRAACQADGGDLITVNNFAEQFFAKNYFLDTFHDVAWVGLNDIAAEGTWVWANGETSTFQNDPYKTCAEGPLDGYVMPGIMSDGNLSAVDFASYGTPNGYCGHYELGSCHAAASATAVGTACNGQPNCALRVLNSDFGGSDPCPSTSKRAYIQYSTTKTSNWASGEPNEATSGNCGTMWSYRDGRFADHICSSTTPYTLCEAPMETNLTGGSDPEFGPEPDPFTAPVLKSTSRASDSAGVLNVAKPAGTLTGDLLIWTVALDGPAVPSTIVWPYGFTQIASEFIPAPDSQTVAVAWKIANGTEPATLLANFGSGYDSVSAMQRFTGFDTTQPIEASISQAHTGVLPYALTWPSNTASITTTVDNARVVWVTTSDQPGMPPDYVNQSDPPTGFLERIENRSNGWVTLGVADKVFRTAGATGPINGAIRDMWASAGGSSYNNATATIAYAIRPGSGGGKTDKDSAAIKLVGSFTNEVGDTGSRAVKNVNVTMPTDIEAGDFILLANRSGQGNVDPGYISWPAGFIEEDIAIQGNETQGWAWKIADGSETTLTVSNSSANAVTVTGAVYRYVDQVNPIAGKSKGDDTTFDPHPWPYTAPSITVPVDQSGLILIPYFGGDFPWIINYGAKLFEAPDDFVERENGTGYNGFTKIALFDNLNVGSGASGPQSGIMSKTAPDKSEVGATGVFMIALNPTGTADAGSGSGSGDDDEADCSAANTLLQICSGGAWRGMGAKGSGGMTAPSSTNSVCNSGTTSSVRYNASSGIPEYCNGSAWAPFVLNEAGVVLTASPATLTGMNSRGNTDSAVREVTITNSGSIASGPLTVVLSGADIGKFDITTDQATSTCDDTTSLAPGATCKMLVRARSATDGPYTANLEVKDAVSTAVISMLGAGLDNATCAPGKLGFGGIILSCVDSTTPYYVLTGAGCGIGPSEPACTNLPSGNVEPQAFNYPASPNFGKAPYGPLGRSPEGDISTRTLLSYGVFPAAYACDQLVKGGYTNWYLPSNDEWTKIIYPMRDKLMLSEESWYWTSTFGPYANPFDQTGGIWTGDGSIEERLVSNEERNFRCLRKHGVAMPTAARDPVPFFGSPFGGAFAPVYTTSLSTQVTSAQIWTIGLNTSTPVTISGPGSPQFRIDAGGGFGAYGTTGNVNLGHKLQVRVTSPPGTGQEYAVVVTIGSTNHVFLVRTIATVTKKIFVTPSGTTGAHGGLTGADAKCQTAANAASPALPAGSYYALLGGRDVNAFNRIPWNWNRLETTRSTPDWVASNIEDLANTNANGFILNRNPSGATISGGNDVWTGMSYWGADGDGLVGYFTNTDPGWTSWCGDPVTGENGDWTDFSSTITGHRGRANGVVSGNTWIDYDRGNCNSNYKLYCIGPFAPTDR